MYWTYCYWYRKAGKESSLPNILLSNCSSPSSTPLHFFTHCYPSPFPIGEDWIPHWDFCTDSSCSDVKHNSLPTAIIIVLSHFLLAAELCLSLILNAYI